MDELIEVEILEVNNLNIDQLRNKIGALSQTEDGQPLRNAMNDLKKALKENSAACSLLLPEDIGSIVEVLKKMTNRQIIADLEPKKRNAGKKESLTLTKEELESISPEDLM